MNIKLVNHLWDAHGGIDATHCGECGGRLGTPPFVRWQLETPEQEIVVLHPSCAQALIPELARVANAGAQA